MQRKWWNSRKKKLELTGLKALAQRHRNTITIKYIYIKYNPCKMKNNFCVSSLLRLREKQNQYTKRSKLEKGLIIIIIIINNAGEEVKVNGNNNEIKFHLCC